MQIDPAISWAIAFSVAALLATAAVQKLRDRIRFREVVRNYQLLPHSLVPLAAAVAITLELCAALMLLVVTVRPIGAVLAASLLLAYATAMAINLGRGRVHLDCGCMGIGTRQPVRWWMVARNVLIAGVTLAAGQPMATRELTALDGVTVVGATLSLAALYAAQNVLGTAARALVR